MSDVVEMSLKPVHEAVLGLPHILDSIASACEGVYEVGALTGHVVFRDVAPPRG